MHGLDEVGHQEAATLKQQLLLVRVRRVALGRHQRFNRSLPLVAFIRSDEALRENPSPGCSRHVEILPVAHAIK